MYDTVPMADPVVVTSVMAIVCCRSAESARSACDSFATPKSSTFTMPRRVMKRFGGLMSR
jgi:hypothetical protein